MEPTAPRPATPQSDSPQPAAPPGGGRDGSAALDADFETFLRMLTTQMRNQDPLNPMESSDFAVQLATFSGVEQQVRTNQILGDLGPRLGASGLGQLSGWVGMTARAPGPIAFDGAPVPLRLPADPAAETARLVIRDDAGEVVQELAAPAEGGRVAWAGAGADGTPLPAGTYTAEVVSYAGDTRIGAQPALLEGRVVEARLAEGGDARLVLEGGQTVAASAVTGLRAPEA